MSDDLSVLHEKKQEKLAELKNEAFAKLERRGYEVRGKTPAQIRQVLKRRPTKPPSIAEKRGTGPFRPPLRFKVAPFEIGYMVAPLERKNTAPLLPPPAPLIVGGYDAKARCLTVPGFTFCQGSIST
jgi:hypothetical protein